MTLYDKIAMTLLVAAAFWFLWVPFVLLWYEDWRHSERRAARRREQYRIEMEAMSESERPSSYEEGALASPEIPKEGNHADR